MEHDLPFAVLGAPTSGALGERVFIKAKNAVVIGVENGYDLTPSKWEGLASKLLLNTVDASHLFTAYEVVGPSYGISGYFVAAGCYESGDDASKSYTWLRAALATLPSYKKYSSGIWCVRAPADSSDPLDIKLHHNFVDCFQCVYMSGANFKLRGNHGIVWEILPSTPYGRILIHPFSAGAKSSVVESGLRPDLTILWR